ncbi:iron chelate uptake ABC transporter family permease subunit, partial [Vibrio parahaemolyticus]|nr:iron chelate uptake ABC transporter family permease subunit [Vibrio parahaemolyticus]
MMNQTKLIALLGLLLIASSLTLFVGAANLSAQQVFALLFSFSDSDFVIHQYRLPRMLLAIGVGAGLGLSGVLVQGVIRNPLASPDLMGISAGAGLAATACLVLYPNAPVAMLPMVAMAGGLLAAGFIAVLAYW